MVIAFVTFASRKDLIDACRVQIRCCRAVLATGIATSAAPANASADPYVGDLMLVGFNFCPRGWTPAAGQLLPISSNTALFSLYGTIYGGDGRSTFGLPDLRGRVPLSQGTGPGLLQVKLGQKSGVE